jgi:hypothetical protein
MHDSKPNISAVPGQLFDLRNIYNPELVTQYLPTPYPQELSWVVKPWLEGSARRSGWMRSDWFWCDRVRHGSVSCDALGSGLVRYVSLG